MPPPPLNIQDAFSVKGQAVVVTGAGGLIGAVIAEAFAVNGAAVLLHDHLEKKKLHEKCDELAGRGFPVAGFAADLAQPEELRKIIPETIKQFGAVHTLVNCAGIPGSRALGRENEHDFDRLYHVNVRALWLLTQEAAGPMKTAGGGAVVNIASINGHRATFPCSLYGGTKAAVLNMTREMAVELAPQNIRVNSISPGWIQPGGDRFKAVKQALTPPFAEAFERQFGPMMQGKGMQFQPTAGSGAPPDVAMAVIYLSSPAARFITGADILVDGGLLHQFPFHLESRQIRWKALRRHLRKLPAEAWIAGRPAWMSD